MSKDSHHSEHTARPHRGPSPRRGTEDQATRQLDPPGAKAGAIEQLQALADASSRVRAGEAIQRAADRSPQIQRAVQRQATADRSATVESLAARMQQLSGVDLSDLRVRYDSPEPRALQAHAFTKGAEIHLGPGQQHHLAHEMWHAVQQKQGRVTPTRQLKGESINDSDALEREADVMGARALALPEPSRPRPAPHAAGPGAATRAAGPGAAQAVVQGKFGLEVELDVNLSNTAAPTEDVVTEPRCTEQPIIAKGTYFDVHKDRKSLLAGVGRSLSAETPNYAIVELTTTPPFDENDSWETVRGQLQPMLAAITWFGAGLGAPRSLRAMPGFTSLESPDANVYVGGPVSWGTQSATGRVHINAGVTLARMTQFLRLIDDYHAEGAAHKNPIAEYSRTRTALKLGTKIAQEFIADDLGRKELAGLLTLLARYMLYDKVASDGELGKNTLGALFYKSELHQIRNHFVSDSARACLDDPVQSQALIARFFALLQKYRIEAGAGSPGDPDISNEDWVKDVLAGVGPDHILEELNNPYSRIFPIEENEHGNPLFVMENRAPQQWASGSLDYTSNDQIVSLVAFYYEMLRQYNTTQ